MKNELCQAIGARLIVSFTYKGRSRTVEPYLVGYNKSGNLALSAWYLYGASDSNEGPGWRSYLLEEIVGLVISTQTFDGLRSGYQPNGGKSFHNIQCAV